MKKSLLAIGEMAKLNQTTICTLRLYDKLDLLKPYYTDPKTKYRFYNVKQNARFDLIQYMKELGMSLHEIKDVLNKEDIELIESILINKREQIFNDIRALKMKRAAITRTINNIEHYRKAPYNNTLTLEYIDMRYIYALKSNVNFYDYDITMYEYALSKLKEHLLKENLPQVYYYTVGTSIKKEDFLRLNYVADEIFIFVDKYFPSNSKVIKIPSGMFACIYLDSYDLEIEGAKKLLNYCNENNYNICGDYLCEVLTEFNVFNCDERSMFLRLQVPISFNKNND